MIYQRHPKTSTAALQLFPTGTIALYLGVLIIFFMRPAMAVSGNRLDGWQNFEPLLDFIRMDMAV